MSGYLPEIRFSTEFEGDEVTVIMKPLSRGALLKLLPVVRRASVGAVVKDEDGAPQLKVEDPTLQLELLEITGTILREHVVGLEGLLDRNGKAIPTEVVIETAVFLPLCIRCLDKLLVEANLGNALPTASDT